MVQAVSPQVPRAGVAPCGLWTTSVGTGLQRQAPLLDGGVERLLSSAQRAL